VVPLETVNGDSNVDECMSWIRNHTPADTLVASNMWRIPGGFDQKYFLVSQKTKRRLVIDGPDYVNNAGAFPERRTLETLKNVVDDFVYSPTVSRLYDLRATKADYLIIDESRPHSSRIRAFAPVVLINERCSVHAL
jgi:hypothetical protein